MSSLSWDKQCCSPNLRPAQPPGAHLKSFLGPGRAPKGHAVVGADVGPVSTQGRPPSYMWPSPRLFTILEELTALIPQLTDEETEVPRGKVAKSS